MEPEQKSNGALLGSVIIVIILVIGGFYLWQVNAQKRALMLEDQTQQDNTDTTSIEAELDNTDLETLDSDI